MTIAFVVFGTLDRRSGGFRYDSELAEVLRTREHEVYVVSQRWSPRYGEQLAGARERAWIDELLGAAPDLVLIDELNHASTAAALPELRRRLGATVPIVAIVHHLRSDERPGLLGARLTERRFLRGCDGWLCNGNTTLDRVVRVSGTMRSAAVVMPGRDDPSPTASPPSGFRVLTVGSLEPRKNMHTLIRVIAGIPSASLTVVGSREVDPSYVARLERRIMRLGASDRIVLRGRVTDKELAQLYGNHHAFALPSRYEGFGIVYLEAMERGLPVIATSRGGARDLVRPGIDGYLVDPRSPGAIAAAVLSLATDTNLRQRMGESAARRARSFPSWGRTMRGAAMFLETMVHAGLSLSRNRSRCDSR